MANEAANFEDRRMTVREVAERVGVAYSTVAGYAQKAGWTENGKQTLLAENQVTLIVEAMKRGTNNQHNLPSGLEGVETTKSRALRVDLLHKQIEAELNAEIAELRVLNAALTPKAAYHDALIAHDHLTNFRDTAKELGIPEKQFIQTLIDRGYIYRSIRGDIKPYHDKMKCFSMKDWESNGHTGARTLITVEGKKRFMALFGTCEQECGAAV
jgi:phage antirepressor YoqD-like protein